MKVVDIIVYAPGGIEVKFEDGKQMPLMELIATMVDLRLEEHRRKEHSEESDD